MEAGGLPQWLIEVVGVAAAIAAPFGWLYRHSNAVRREADDDVKELRAEVSKVAEVAETRSTKNATDMRENVRLLHDRLNNAATKEDLKLLEDRMSGSIGELRADLRSQHSELLALLRNGNGHK